MRSIFKARANFRTVPATSERASKTAMNCYPKSPADSKSAAASSKISFRNSKPNSNKPLEARKQADEQAAITYVLDRLDPKRIKRLLKQALSLASRAHRQT